jgi:hypothetical protein
MKNPLKSPLLWGTYDVVYCSKPSAVGGPLTKGPGPVLAAGQRARQILQVSQQGQHESTLPAADLLLLLCHWQYHFQYLRAGKQATNQAAAEHE